MARPNAGDLSRAAMLERLRDTAGCASEAAQKSSSNGSSSPRVSCSTAKAAAVEPVCTTKPAPTTTMSASPPEKTSSVLKPLEELTDADITQLTREDCRKYLKARGMRRPSWNKAQAIEQVRSLRSLFGSKPQDSPSSEPPSSSKQNGIGNHETMQFMHKVSQQSMPHCLSTDSDPAVLGAFGSPFPMYGAQPFLKAPTTSDASAKTAVPPRPAATAGRSHTAQLTIFYSGVVNVYDDVPLEKAQAIMLLAGSKTFHVPSPPMACMESSTLQCPPPVVHAHAQQATAASAGGNNVHGPFANLSEPALQQEEIDPGLPQARTASLQRFLAKRRERITANPPYRRCEKVKRRKSSAAAAAAAVDAAGAASSIPNGHHHHHHQLLHKLNECSMTSKSSGSSDTSMPSTTTRGTSFSNAESTGAGDGKIGGELEDASSIRTRIDYFGKAGAGAGAARTPEEVVSAI